ncbi:LOW QUALITY PROTEIN: hypothetical protein QYF61_016921 [Mycteria americana]|uniref:Uncharacterized protein n=1 Tax=Mycteria americana TaxID=33587 RepID=A0AAN7S192_MYCAM|nr:LOW QUALITY PROTEIN: hypothetical protein QYF61_016921 [Mycteria americana]
MKEGEELPLQPTVKTIMRQAVPLQPVQVHGGGDITCSLWRTPRRSRWMPEGGCDPVGSLCWSRVPAGPVDQDLCWSSLFLKDCTPWKGPTLEQFVKNCSPWEGLTLDKFVEDCLLWEGPHAGQGKCVRSPLPEEEGAAETTLHLTDRKPQFSQYKLETVAFSWHTGKIQVQTHLTTAGKIPCHGQFQAHSLLSLLHSLKHVPSHQEKVGGDLTTSLGSLFQCLTTLSVKKLFLISNLSLPWHNLRTFPLVLWLDIWEKRPTPTSLQPPFRLNNASSLSCSSSDFCSRPFTSFTALLWTRSSTSMSLLCGLTSAKYRGTITSLVLLATLFFIQARMPLAFLATWAHCWLIFRQLLTNTPINPACPDPSSLPTLKQINTPTQLGVICKLTEGALDPFVQITGKDMKWSWSQHRALGNTACEQPPTGFNSIQYNSLGPAIQPVFYPEKRTPTKAMSSQFLQENAVGNGVKGFTKV